MNPAKSLEESHEPMEIEEIGYADLIEQVRPFIKKEKDAETEDSRPNSILRRSKLTKILNSQNSAKPDRGEQGVNDDERIATTATNSKPQRTKATNQDGSKIRMTKSKLRSLVKTDATGIQKAEKSSFFFFWQMTFFILFPIAVLVACVAISRQEFDPEVCAHRFDATEAIGDLKNQIFGQTEAIRELSSHLAMKTSGLKILGIIGGTGVGKSYAAHIISKNYPVKRNVFQYVPPLKPRRRFASSAISVCGCNLIVLENLNNRDIPEAVDFVEYLSGKIDNVNYCLLIIAVINVQETDNNLQHRVDLAKSKIEIENIFRAKNFHLKVVEFQPLDDEPVTKCIIDAANNRNLTLSKSQIDDIRIGLKISDTGCKGASAKVNLIDEKINLI